jgi:hypothetical protein
LAGEIWANSSLCNALSRIINSRAIDRDEAEFFMSEHVEGLALHLDDANQHSWSTQLLWLILWSAAPSENNNAA